VRLSQRTRFPESIVAVRIPLGEDLSWYFEEGIRVFHLVANYHGQTAAGFIMDVLQKTNQTLVDKGIREQVTLIGSGGIGLAEHVPKAIICGLDVVALDIPLLVALQGLLQGECALRERIQIILPSNLNVEWGVQRLKNLTAAWRDQLLEILGAMGLREVRRLRGELGRAMFQKDLEREAFGGISGYDS
jgi:hypothetical protein